MANRRWSEEETILALHLYFQLPFGKLHSGNAEIQELADAIDRTHSSLAMKLCNFASLDPKITETGRKGLEGASKLDHKFFAEFQNDWTGLVARAELLHASLGRPSSDGSVNEDVAPFTFEPYTGATTAEATLHRRVRQDFFRRAVLANYEECCCITGIADPRLLTASHITPWSVDVANRHNPANGLLLSATYDRAFDRGLLTINTDGRVRMSRQLTQSASAETRDYFRAADGRSIRPSSRFNPDPVLLQWHNEHCFSDDPAAGV